MVQILKPQMRNYQADQTEAIRQQQITQNISEVSNLVAGVANVYNAFQKSAEADKKKAEQADQDIINTEIGEQANIKASVEAEKALGSLDPTSDAGMSAINEAYAKVFSGYEGQMGSERGKIALQTMQRKGADAYIKSASKAYSSEKAVKARQAAANLENAMSFDAEQFGGSGNVDAFNEATAKHVEAIGNYAEAQGFNKQEAVYAQKAKFANDYIGGLALGQPLMFAQISGIDEGARDQMVQAVQKQNPSLSKREAGTIVDEAIQAKKGWSNEQIDKIYGGADTIDYIREQRIQNLEEKKEQYSDKSPAYRKIQEKIESLQGDGIYEVLRAEMRAQHGPLVNRSVQQHILAEDKRRYDETVALIQDSQSPDPITASTAKKQLLDGLSFRERGEYNLLEARGEISEESLKKVLELNERNFEDVKTQPYPTYKGTQGIQSKITELAKDKTSTPAQFALKAAETMNYIHGLEITDGQEEEAQDMVYRIMKDRVGGDLIAKTFDNANKYYPELNWFERYLTGSVASQEDGSIIQQGVELITGSKAPDVVENRGSLRQNRSSKAQAESVLQAELLELNKTAISMANEALMLQGNERVHAMKKIEEYIIKGKQDIFDNKLADYGINMPPLREKLKMGQPVYLQIGAKTKQYLGDNPDGTPKFVDYVDPTIDKKQKTLLERLTGIGERISEVVKSRKGE